MKQDESRHTSKLFSNVEYNEFKRNQMINNIYCKGSKPKNKSVLNMQKTDKDKTYQSFVDHRHKQSYATSNIRSQNSTLESNQTGVQSKKGGKANVSELNFQKRLTALSPIQTSINFERYEKEER